MECLTESINFCSEALGSRSTVLHLALRIFVALSLFLLDCLICARDAMSIVLFLQMMGGWDRWGVVVLY